MNIVRRIGVAAVVLLAGCSEGGGLTEPEAGTLVWSGEDVRITAVGCAGVWGIQNGRSAPLYFDIVDRSMVPDWAPNGERFPRPIAPGQDAGFQFDFFGPPPPRIERAVFWWHVSPAADGSLRPGRVRQVNFTFSC